MRQKVAKRLKRSVLCRKGPLRDHDKWEQAYRGNFYYVDHAIRTTDAGKSVIRKSKQKIYDPVKSPRGAYRALKKDYKDALRQHLR